MKRKRSMLLKTVGIGITYSILLITNCYAKHTTYGDLISSVKIKSLQNIIDKYRTHYHIPGVSVSIILPINNQELTLTSGVMNIENKRKVTSDTLFQIGSITKVYTATLVHQLISGNKLSLSQTVGHWLPQYNKWKRVTIKQLLNMHSGIPSYTEDTRFNDKWQRNPSYGWNTSTILGYVKDKTLLYKPGTNYNYSDTNYILLGMIIEKASHKNYAQLLRTNIIKPLHLKKTFYIVRNYTKKELHYMATGYSQDGKDTMNINVSQANAAGAIIATTKDTAIFFHAVFTGRIIKPEELKNMLVPYSTKSGKKMTANANAFETWAMGVDQQYFKNIGLVWNKFGITPGFFSSANYSINEKATIVMAANKQVPNAIHDIRFIPKLYDVLTSHINPVNMKEN